MPSYQGLTMCRLGVSWMNVALQAGCLQHFGRPQAAVGTDLSCPRIYIRHAFAICLKYILWCSQRVHSVYVTYSQNKSMVFALQKYGFWRAKTTFLAYKNHLFDLQKVVFCIFVKYISIFIDINKEYERTYNKFIKMVQNCLKRQSCHCVLYIFYI